MRYIDVEWKHDCKDEPTRLVSEIGPDNYETRKLEFFPDGSVGYAFESKESLNTRLGIDVVPPLKEINSLEEFQGKTISKKQFELLWQEYVPSSS
ncbi:hypothetical protein [uncultured Paraglaciecola sp.]|uniref:DUF6881 domain-containing protein n=1 Tax=uncultured Paraglaciecola sp. TaxID=1765024 RepID=UPI002599DB7A|nr:hypothetical protein [uncultured Paraglaciecola sp.]